MRKADDSPTSPGRMSAEFCCKCHGGKGRLWATDRRHFLALPPMDESIRPRQHSFSSTSRGAHSHANCSGRELPMR